MNDTVTFDVPSYSHARETGDIVSESGYHQMRQCSCQKDTPKGAYRDVVVDMPDGTRVHFYHQTAVVAVDATRRHYWLNSGGYRTVTTKARINDATPRGVTVRQEDFEWLVDIDGETVPFDDRMVLDAPN